jgi:hypothetical protein
MTLSRVAWALLAAAALSACSPTNHLFIMHAVRARFASLYDKCIPLGWVPVPAAGTYLQGYSAEISEETEWWLPPRWSGSVQASQLQRRDVRAVFQVLNELVRAGMLDVDREPGGFHYHLTMQALPYYVDRDDLGNNPEHFSYLCYSKIVPRRIVWNEAIHFERVRGVAGKAKVFRAAVQWLPGPQAAWADDPILRSHGVILASTERLIIVKFVNSEDSWQVDFVNSGFPSISVVDASAWPKSQ